MYLKSIFIIFIFSTFLLSGCLASTQTVDDQQDSETAQTESIPDQLLDIVLLYNSAPEDYSSGVGRPREPAFRKNIEDDFEFNKKFSESELLISDCIISHAEINPQYQNRQVEWTADAADKMVVDFISENEITLPVIYSYDDCNQQIQSGYDEIDLLPVPYYVYASWAEDGGVDPFEPIAVFSFEDIESASAKIEKEKDQIQSNELGLQKEYAESKNHQSENFIGSMFVKINTIDERWEADDQYNQGPSFYPQNVCALEKNSSIPQSIIGYRAFDREILSEDLKSQYEAIERQSQTELRITGNGNKLSFFKTFSTLNDAYMYFSDLKYGHDVPGCEVACGNHSDWEESCAIFVAPAREVEKLSSALADDGIQSAYGKLFSVTESNEHAAVEQGFQSHDEFQFVTEEKLITQWDQLQTLRQYDANSPEKFDRLKAEIRASEYTEDNLSISVILAYLKDRQVAREKNTDVLKEKQERLARQAAQKKQREEVAARKQAEKEENFPYVATLSCEFQGNHTNIAACFLGGEYAANTQLELTNGNSSQIYQGYELNSVGRELRSGLVIDLTRSFNMQAQNASDRLSLRLRIVERKGGEVVFEDIVSQYGVISVQN
jgi:hypothetical protein